MHGPGGPNGHRQFHPMPGAHGIQHGMHAPTMPPGPAHPPAQPHLMPAMRGPWGSMNAPSSPPAGGMHAHRPGQGKAHPQMHGPPLLPCQKMMPHPHLAPPGNLLAGMGTPGMPGMPGVPGVLGLPGLGGLPVLYYTILYYNIIYYTIL